MEGKIANGNGRLVNRIRVLAWGGLVLLLLIPLVAMQFTDEVNWGLFDFLFIGAMLFGAGLAFEIVVRLTGDMRYRAGVAVALVSSFLLAWISAGVGIIGRDGDPANLMFGAVVAVGGILALVGRFRAAGMARAMVGTAVAQVLVAAVALLAGFGRESANWPFDILGLTGFFTVLWLFGAWLFHKARKP